MTITREQLKEQTELLTLLENYEHVSKCSEVYGQGSMTISTKDTQLSLNLDSSYRGIKQLSHKLNDIAIRHFDLMIKEQIRLIKKQITIRLQDK